MIRIALFASLFATTTLFTACTDADPAGDELAGEVSDEEAGKDDGAGAFTYFGATYDPDCEGEVCTDRYLVRRIQRTSTTCGNGRNASSCFVDGIQWNGIALADSDAASFERSLKRGDALILKGDIVRPVVHPPERPQTWLSISEIWVAHGEESVDRVVALVQCANAACTKLAEKKVNSTRTATIQEVDFDASGESEAQIARATEALREGVIVVGDRYFPTSHTKGREATSYFTKAQIATP
jgi:hypothetical protein